MMGPTTNFLTSLKIHRNVSEIEPSQT